MRLARRSITVDTFERAAGADGFRLDLGQRAVAEQLSRVELRPGRGVYLWGPVGRGKTWLIDAYRAALKGRRTSRVHFHDFFRRLHSLVPEHGIDAAMDLLLDGCQVLFFDEFHVHDVGDGALLSRLLRALDERGTALVVTSNYPPDGLMPNPLFHDNFLPTIAVLRERLEVIELVGDRDYRSGRGPTTSGFASGRRLAALSGWPVDGERAVLSPFGRPIVARAVRGDLVWFDFVELCERPTSVRDYLRLAADHGHWVVSGVPPILEATPDGVQRFCTLVDVLHDRDVPLTVVGADWCEGDALPVERVHDLARTRSRLSMLAN
ncbi:cell division protein ZapE [Rhodococcus spelaei]|uniref:Cell division protein ZapE n=1 Tax=Rhodococcus spelaei TaxID=2546320 RepID=A0A541BS43_9NOCA|nr:cell division protein ZapE [Rhodococcus spelaei]TQF75105.1 cell division protein ZapE [Rhodococcus spelaei]